MTISDGKNYKNDDFLEDEEIVIGISGKEIGLIYSALHLWASTQPSGNEEFKISKSIAQSLLDKNLEIAKGYYNKYLEEAKK